MRRLIVAVVMGVLVVACGSAAEVTVRPFSDVQGSDITFVNDPDFPGRAIFSVTTTEPLICAIVWGETEELGNFNNSLAMNGTGIEQHDVFLPGAEAGETYYYRLQGSGPDGTLYVSELATFTLPAADTTAAPLDLSGDLAIGAEVVEFSSQFSDSFRAEYAVDGNLSTEWSSAGDGNESSITIDLGSETAIGEVAFLTRTMTDGSATTTTFTVSIDGQTLGPFDAGTPADPRPAPIGITGRQIRFDVADSTGGNTGAIEILVFGP